MAYVTQKIVKTLTLSLNFTILLQCYVDGESAFEPRHEISNNVVHVCATGKASDQPAHTRSLIRALASRLNILLLLATD